LVNLLLIDISIIISLLCGCIILNIILIKTDKLKKKEKAFLSALTIAVSIFMATNLYMHYEQTILHAMNHTLFKVAYITGLVIVVQGFDFKTLTAVLNSIEFGFFDQLNYIPKKVIVSSAEKLRKIQSGNLNLNMFMVLSFFILCLVMVFIL
jgi:hypothetical protein